MTRSSIAERPAFPDPTIGGPDYWYGQINEKVAATFLDLQPRTLQAYRQRGSGPRYVAISPRCVRYRRVDLRVWAEARLRTCTHKVGSSSQDRTKDGRVDQ